MFLLVCFTHLVNLFILLVNPVRKKCFSQLNSQIYGVKIITYMYMRNLYGLCTFTRDSSRVTYNYPKD